MEFQKLTNIQQKCIELLGLSTKRASPKGWLLGRCPFCSDESKFGVRFNTDRSEYKNHLSFNCFKGSCGSKGTEWELFKHLNVLYLLSHKEFISKDLVLDNSIGKVDISLDLELEVETQPFPIGWQQIYNHQYLVQRGWRDIEFKKHQVGITNLYTPLMNYIILLVLEDGNNKGYIARSITPQIELDRYNKEVKEYNKTVPVSQRKPHYPKYSNQPGVYFEKLLFGIDDILSSTTTVILVEGIFDKINIDRILNLYNNPNMKCVCTFGKKISKVQAAKLYNKGIKNILILYDPDAINTTKPFGFQLESFFKVMISVHPTKDAGEMDLLDFELCISTAKAPLSFFTDMVGISSIN